MPLSVLILIKVNHTVKRANRGPPGILRKCSVEFRLSAVLDVVWVPIALFKLIDWWFVYQATLVMSYHAWMQLLISSLGIP